MADVRQVINRVNAGDTIEMVNFFQGRSFLRYWYIISQIKFFTSAVS